MNSNLTLVGMLTCEKTARREHQRDVPDSVGSKPFIFSIKGPEWEQIVSRSWHATNRKGADWKQILKKSKDFTGDLHQQFADLKEWLESDWRGNPARAVPTADPTTAEALVAMASSVNVFDGLKDASRTSFGRPWGVENRSKLVWEAFPRRM